MLVAGGVVGRIGVAEGGVRGHVYAVGFVPRKPRGLLEIGMELKLVEGGFGGGVGDQEF